MSWAFWLAVPIAATALSALWAWWRGVRQRRGADAGRLDTVDAIRAHQAYLDALTLPVRAQVRCVGGMDLRLEREISGGFEAPSSAS